MNATAAWRAVSGSVRGSSHVRSGAPNQDAAKVVAFERPTTGVVAAVADGHGGERYVRSDVGARVAVDVACETARVWAAASAALPKRAMLASLRDELAPEIVARWRADVDQHVQDAPFDDDELARLRDDSDPRIAYGATLLMAIAIDDCIALAQLGDGDIIVVGGGDAVHQPIAPDDRLIGGQTTSLCLSTAEDDFRYAVVEAQ
ncbi:MAG TPA: protein phosphatase 2C domain-containing protein, partial [Acidimicrobiia bacterium]|nr:protein phosphatase 2C domain-containing protein [Acidimicrobiia bacterium]